MKTGGVRYGIKLKKDAGTVEKEEANAPEALFEIAARHPP